MIYYAENTLNKQNTYKNAARHAGRSGRRSPYWLVSTSALRSTYLQPGLSTEALCHSLGDPRWNINQ